ncbi:hypothetical protein SDC9_107635 [bioreactor metagenome]|uniref:NADP-dependent oxidoreductase domain-containing protein n=1 Tax=bioreactor metagenome TaxID=1076179 RepID=A0A645B847_9ZZZZ
MPFSKLILGTVQFGLNYGINNCAGKPDDGRIDAILRTAADGGIDALDTARAYGDSEERLGAALARTGLAGHFHLISKVKLYPEIRSRADAEQAVEKSVCASLKALRRDTLDGLLLHNENDLEYLPLLEALRRRGLTGFIGASLDSLAGLARLGATLLPAAQVPANILDRRFQTYLQRAHRAGQRIFVRSVYLQGLLFKPAGELSRPLAETVLPVRIRLEQLAASAGMPPGELYFRYLLSDPACQSILTGVDTPEQLQENLKLAARGALTDDLLRAIAAIVPELPEECVRPSAWPKA